MDFLSHVALWKMNCPPLLYLVINQVLDTTLRIAIIFSQENSSQQLVFNCQGCCKYFN